MISAQRVAYSTTLTKKKPLLSYIEMKDSSSFVSISYHGKASGKAKQSHSSDIISVMRVIKV